MLNKVTDYDIISHHSPQELARMVREKMTDNWTPSGPILASGKDLMQAMVKFS